MGLLLALIIICGAFSAVPFAAEAEHTAVDPEGAVTTDTAPEKGGVASTGASFGEGMKAVSSEDAALSSAGGTADAGEYSAPVRIR